MTTAVTLAATTDSTYKGLTMKRIVNVVRLHFVNPSTLIVLPWIIMVAVLLLHFAIWAIVRSSVGPEQSAAEGFSRGFSTSATWMFVYMLIVAVQAVSLTFPFALGMSVSRGEYAIGTGITFLLVSVVNGTVFTLLSYVEQWTNGWGLNGSLFAMPFVTQGPLAERWLVFFVCFALFFFIGWVAAAVFVRWRAFGLVGLGVIFVALLVGFAALATWTQSWPTIGEWFVANQAGGVAAWMLVPTAIAAVCGTLLLRGSTPRS